jgi:hypothetical protein
VAVGVLLGSFFMMLRCLGRVAMGCMGMMCSLNVVARFMVLRRFMVMLRSVFVVFRRLLVVLVNMCHLGLLSNLKYKMGRRHGQPE